MAFLTTKLDLGFKTTDKPILATLSQLTFREFDEFAIKSVEPSLNKITEACQHDLETAKASFGTNAHFEVERFDCNKQKRLFAEEISVSKLSLIIYIRK